MFRYSGLGFSVDSELEFPELQSLGPEGGADVIIRLEEFESLPTNIRRISKSITFSVTGFNLFFFLKDVANFKVDENRLILIDTQRRPPDLQSIRSVITGTLFVFIAMNRGLLALHASAVLHHKQLFVFAGRSGAGKSSTIAGLGSRGFDLFSDDIILLHLQEGLVTGRASYPMIKLWEHTLTNLNQKSFSDRSFQVKVGFDKYGLFFHDKFTEGAFPLKVVTIIALHNGGEVKVRKLSSTEAFLKLADHIHRPMFLHNAGMHTKVFQILSTIAAETAVYEILRPMECPHEDLIAEAANLIADLTHK